MTFEPAECNFIINKNTNEQKSKLYRNHDKTNDENWNQQSKNRGANYVTVQDINIFINSSTFLRQHRRLSKKLTLKPQGASDDCLS